MKIFVRSIYASALMTVTFIIILYISDLKHRESGVNVGLAVFAGILSAFSVLVVRTLFPTPFGIHDPESLLGAINQNFFRAGFLEEFVKYLFFFAFIWGLPFEEFPEEYDGMLYFGSLGGGFALYEDFLYIFSRTNYFWQLGKTAKSHSAFRSMMFYRSLPGHILFGALAGYFIGKAKFCRKEGRRIKFIVEGFFLAVLAHGLFNSLADAGGEYGALIFTIILIWIAYGLRNILIEDSPFTAIERFEEGGIFNRWKALEEWDRPRSIEAYVKLKEEAEAEWTIGLLPVILSLIILFPLLIGSLYMLNQVMAMHLPPLW